MFANHKSDKHSYLEYTHTHRYTNLKLNNSICERMKTMIISEKGIDMEQQKL